MAGPKRRVLAVAARTGRIGCVILVAGELKDWQISRIGARSSTQATRVLRRWMVQYQPDTMISEHPETATRKSNRQRGILAAFAAIGEEEDALNISVTREKRYRNIYAEAAALAGQYPLIREKLPDKPPIWMPEPRNMIYFEALAMARQVLEDPKPQGGLPGS
ncbi:MAG: hypothetical protein JKY94_08715 [Rhodobacteraceae bacterium]|nr:hypothetical protein [Paracoccaceae bacterium]